jgi:prepilin-type N-terminal cleavage/methylation domain-containing protein
LDQLKHLHRTADNGYVERRRDISVSGPLGFTLIELMVVVVIIGILAAIGTANFVRMEQNARLAGCKAHQRGVFEAAYAYQIDRVVPDGAMNVSVLHAAGFVADNICECPSSHNVDHDDYEITWLNNLPIDVTCLVMGVEHEYAP